MLLKAIQTQHHGRKTVNWKGNQKNNYAFHFGMLIGKMINLATNINESARLEANQLPSRPANMVQITKAMTKKVKLKSSNSIS